MGVKASNGARALNKGALVPIHDADLDSHAEVPTSDLFIAMDVTDAEQVVQTRQARLSHQVRGRSLH